jgi:hypothetical protein
LPLSGIEPQLDGRSPISGREKRLFSSSSTLLHNGYLSKGIKLTPPSSAEVKKVELYLHCPIRLNDVVLSPRAELLSYFCSSMPTFGSRSERRIRG